MFVRVFEFRGPGDSKRSRAATIALITAALAAGAVLFVFAFMLLLGLAAAGTVIGSAMLVYRRLTGRGRHGLGRGLPDDDFVLDPSREVFPDRSSHAALPPDEGRGGK